MDLNGDGYPDLLSGSYSRSEQPMAGLFQVLWGQADRTFKKAAVLNGTDGKPLVIPAKSADIDDVVDSICTRPFAVDWAGDGNLDLVVGTFRGTFYLFKGEGHGKFAPQPEQIKTADGKPLAVPGYHSDPFLVDWDGDGALDLLSGSSKGGVWLAKNTAGPKKPPVFKEFKELIPPPKEERSECRPNEVKAPASATRIWVGDVNGDGKLDILVGDCVTLIAPAKGVSEADFTRRYAEWRDAVAALEKEREGLTEKDKDKSQSINERMSKLYETRKEFLSEDRTGFVWLYLQK